MMRSSNEAFDFIVAQEVTDRAYYEAHYRRPEWPGESSGVTVGIGYDLGQTARETIAADWRGRVSDAMFGAMLSACGVTGSSAETLTARLRAAIDIPWDTAIAVHRDCVIPRWEAVVEKALPNTDKLSPDSFGALVSLTFNRGPSFAKDGDRYREMRAIKAHMVAGEFEKIPAEFRAMKRLWIGRGVDGLLARRNAEAALFERGLKARPPQPAAPAQPAQLEQTVMPPWLNRMTAILGLYEAPGSADNPLILEMAKVCGGQIAETYNHDSIAWCALTANYCLVGSGFPGNDSLWALDFAGYGRKLSGPAVGAIATKKRYEGGKQVGGHVFLVVGKTKQGVIVGRGGNQSDMVCDELFDPDIITGYNWPADYPAPVTGMMSLPIVTPAPKTKRQLAALPPPMIRDDSPGSSEAAAHTPTDEPPLRGDPLIWRVQRILGFTGDDLDGEFGAKTEAAVRQFQADHRLTVDGEVGPDTWAALDRYEAEKAQPVPKPPPDPAPAKIVSQHPASSGLFSWLGRLFGRKG